MQPNFKFSGRYSQRLTTPALPSPVWKCGLRAATTWDSLRKALSLGKEFIFGLMALATPADGSMTKWRAKGSSHGLMVALSKAVSKTGSCTDMAFTSGRTGDDMRVTT